MLNQVLQGDCLELMKQIPDKSIDMILTSPPYDNLRTYNGSLDWGEHVWKPVIQELYRVTKDGGVIVWVVGDATIKGSETGTSFKQALYFKEIGFNLHDTMIYRKNHFAPYDPKCNRYYQEFEYMFVLSKGKPSVCNYIMIDSIHAGDKTTAYSRSPDGSLRLDRKEITKNHRVNEKKIKANIWNYNNHNKPSHPAPFPEKLAEDHILSWSNEGDTVLDPFAGSGTVGKMAKQLNRNYILMEKEQEYVDIINARLGKNDTTL